MKRDFNLGSWSLESNWKQFQLTVPRRVLIKWRFNWKTSVARFFSRTADTSQHVTLLGYVVFSWWNIPKVLRKLKKKWKSNKQSSTAFQLRASFAGNVWWNFEARSGILLSIFCSKKSRESWKSSLESFVSRFSTTFILLLLYTPHENCTSCAGRQTTTANPAVILTHEKAQIHRNFVASTLIFSHINLDGCSVEFAKQNRKKKLFSLSQGWRSWVTWCSVDISFEKLRTLWMQGN